MRPRSSGVDADDQHKLCGYLRAVLAVGGNPPKPPSPGSACSLFKDGADVGFRSDDGAVLLPVGDGNADPVACPPSTPPSSSRKRRRMGSALVNGSASVVHQLQALAGYRCLKVEARVLDVACREDDVRAVVLVDVYLPITAWSGWQFPRSHAVAVALFKHVSCDWEARSSLLAINQDAEDHSHVAHKCIWNCADCHVIGCEKHINTFDSDNKNLFDLHEIFKSLPTARKDEVVHSTRIKPEEPSTSTGIWDVANDVLAKLLTSLGPKDLVRVAATCHHLRSLAASIMPCMKLKLFPHQEAAVEWMLNREHSVDVLPHPLYMVFSTEDGFSIWINTVSGEISTGVAPTINDIRGGMFCDEPGLGKTVTALSLILKTHGTLAEPPDGVDVVWCMHNPEQRCGYYELSTDDFTPGNYMSNWKRFIGQEVRKGNVCSSNSSLEYCLTENSNPSSGKRRKPRGHEETLASAASSCSKADVLSPIRSQSMPAPHILRCTSSCSRAKRNLLNTREKNSEHGNKRKAEVEAMVLMRQSNSLPRLSSSCKKAKEKKVGHSDPNETWVQCDACRKWRKLLEKSTLDVNTVWFCSMNSDPSHRSCTSPQESWDQKQKITYLPGFYTKGTRDGREQNVSFFTNVLKEHFTLFNSDTMKALTWLASLPCNKLLEMETVGLTSPVLDVPWALGRGPRGCNKIFQAFGLLRKVERGGSRSRWFYPGTLDNLAFDSAALKIALSKRWDLFRLYLSRATLIVVPANLVDHWKSQIQKHVRPGQLRVYIWADHKKPCAHNLAWDYDIVITTFNRLSVDWGSHKKSILMQVHWLRVMLDEGHTLGSSLSLTNKLQLAISLPATNRWILTGTPTPNTPNSHVSHLHLMLKFLHEEAYGQNQESWDAGIVRPFEAHMEEGRVRLLQLLQRTMISARKSDLKNIPPCIKKVTYLHFSEEHAKSYNELVVTVRRNILMADWNDPSHVESLLNPKQWKLRSNTIRNLRLSCCVAGHIKVADAGQDIQETMEILVQHGLDPLSEEYAFIRNSILDGCSCFRCKDWCRLPVVTPCRHLLCLECIALDSENCTFPGCGNSYEMQSPEILTRPENPNPKWPVPKDLIELQPSYKQDDWDSDWESTSSTKVAYLVERLKAIQESNRNIGNQTKMISTNDGYCRVSNYEMTATKQNGNLCLPLPQKVIVFSQFLEHINAIERQLTFAGIGYGGMYSPLHSSKKIKSLMMFQEDPDCMVLLMDGSAALGLDLSFVTHVFLMEPIWDRSMEEQVISRAHRMGATRPIFVETLAMHGTIEEQMLEFLQDINVHRRTLKDDTSNNHRDWSRAPRTLHDFAESNYLSQLSFVKTTTKS